MVTLLALPFLHLLYLPEPCYFFGMRLFLTFLSCCTVTLLYFADQPRHYHWLKDHGMRAADDFLYHKSVAISGIRALSEVDIYDLLPLDSSTPWWLLNLSLVETKLLSNSLISRASVHACRPWRWGCFEVEIQEREAAFFAIINDRGWLIGHDGGAIMPVSVQEIQHYQSLNESKFASIGSGAVKKRVPVVSGLRFREESPDIIRARFERLRGAIDVVEGASGCMTRSVEFTPDGEIEVRFYGLEFKAIFDASLENEAGINRELLSDRSERLRILLDRFGRKRPPVDSIDLTTENMAVVTLKTQ